MCCGSAVRGVFWPCHPSSLVAELHKLHHCRSCDLLPYMVLSETALSFIGLGLKDPVNSLGVMLQNVTSADVSEYQWYFIP